MAENTETENKPVKRTVLDVDDIISVAPVLANHRKFVKWLMRVLEIDRVNAVHSKYFDTPGAPFVKSLLEDFNIDLRVDNESVLDSFGEGIPFVTVSNHPFGALDGIALIHLIGSRRPAYKVMVNMILNHISAMRPNFIAVDQSASDDPAKRAVSVAGIRQALRQLKEGEPMGFFPAGAMSKTTLRDGLQDRPWQPAVLQIIYKAKVPVIPVFFHGGNSAWCNFLGHACWPARSLRLPAEVFRKNGKEIHISVGQPVTVEEQMQHHGNAEELGLYLRQKTYELKRFK